MSVLKNMLPEGWSKTSFEDIADIGTGNPAPQGEQFFNDGIYPFVRVQDMGRLGINKYMTDTADHINQLATKKLRLFPKGTVLFTKSGASSLLNQRAILKADMYVVSHIATAIPFGGISSDYLYYWLKIIDFNHIAHATTLPFIPLSKVCEIQLSLASPEEQDQIISILEELFSDLDNAIENLKKAQEQLKIYEQAVLQSAFEGKIVSFNETEDKLLGQIGRVKGGKRLSKGQKVQDEETKYPYIRVVDFKDFSVDLISLKYITEDAQKKIARYVIYKDEVFISIAGTIGRVGMIPERLDGANLTENAAKITEIQEVLPRYLMYYLASPRVQGDISFLKKATSQPKLALYRIEKIQVRYPKSENIQYQVIQEIESRLSVCDKIQETIDQNIRNSEVLRQSILKQAFEGKLTEQWRKEHTDLVSGDNSAEALLKKIKAEKETLQVKLKGRKKE